MMTRLIALALLCLTTGPAMAQGAKVAPLMLKDLAGIPARRS